jgi:hypothetical protein
VNVLDTANNRQQNAGQGLAIDQQLQRLPVKLFVLCGLLAFGDVDVAGDKAAAGDWRTANIELGAVGAQALHAVRLEVAGAGDGGVHLLFQIAGAVFAPASIETNQLFKIRPALFEQGRRKIKHHP